MKTLNLKQYLVLFAAIFSLTSCLKSEDPAFQIVATGYINQTVTEGNEGEANTNQFMPVITVQSYGSYEPIVSCSASGGILMSKISETNGLLWVSTYTTPSLELPKDTYNISAMNADNEPASTSVSFSSITKEMKDKLNGNIKYDGKILSFTFSEVGNADQYIVIARESKDYSLYQSTIVETYTNASGDKALEESTFAKNLVSGKTYYFTTIALIGSISTGFSVIQEGPTTDLPYTKE